MKFSTLQGPSLTRRNLLDFLFILIFYLGIIFLFFPGLFLNFSTRIPYGNHGDVKNILGIISFSIQASINQIYHLPVFYPESFVLARVHPLFGISIFFKLFQLLGLNLEQSNNLYIILSLLIGAWGCYLLAREFSTSRILALVFSSIYIIHRWNYFHLIWINFLSRFYIPFIFLFLIRFFKTRKMKYAMIAGILSFCQFFSSVYYGVQLWTLLLPSFVLFALFLRLLVLKDFLKMVLIFGFILVFIIGIFYPYTFVSKSIDQKKQSNAYVTAADLFSYSRILEKFLEYPEKPALGLFPGFVFLLFPIFFLISDLKSERNKFLIFPLLVFLMATLAVLAFLNTKLLNLVFPVFLFLILILVIKKWRSMTKWEKLIVLTFSFYFTVFIRFEGIPFLKSFSLLDLFNQLVPIGGLGNIRRVFLVILPFLIILATLGGEKCIGSLKDRKKGLLIIFYIFLVFSLIVENIPFPLPVAQKTMMKPLPKPDFQVYGKLPFKKNLVLLEIPFYFKLVTRNSIYLLNWRFHQNYLLNGKTSIDPAGYMKHLEKIIGKYQKRFPNERALKTLIEQYSLNYIIFHWNLLSHYQKNPDVKKEVMPLIQSLGRYGEIEYDDDQVTLLKVRENFPIDRVIRHYSWFHLQRNRVVVRLKKPYSGKVEIFFNGCLFEKRDIMTDIFKFDLREQKFHIRGNEIEFRFRERILLKDIELRAL